jgi:hypothetical protein
VVPLGRRDERLGVLDLDDVERPDPSAVTQGRSEHLVEAGQRHR